MKIGILTQPFHHNYGGLLQAYALQTILKRAGHDAWIISREYNAPALWRKAARWAKKVAYRIFLNKKRFTIEEEKKYMAKYTSLFVEKYITPKTIELKSDKELQREINRQNFEGYIVGSDQVWRPMYSPCITNFFLDFAENKNNIKRVAYAASFGVDSWEFSKKQTKKCRRLARLFNAVSVREDSAIQLCEKHLGKEAIQTLDPTLLLDKSDYESLLPDVSSACCGEYVLTYILDRNPEKQSIAEKVAEHLDLRLFSIMPEKTIFEAKRGELNNCAQRPVEEWLQAFKNAKYIVTDSFHGCVFSIIFNKPFIAVPNNKRGATRFTSLFNIFGLNNRLISNVVDLSEAIIETRIDWEKINQIKAEKQEASLYFLKAGLS